MYGSSRTAYSQQNKKYGSFFLESTDNGITWNCKSQISSDGNETSIIKLPNGKIFAAVRKQFLALYESSDNGESWQYVSFLSGFGMYPSAFTLLDNKELLLTYGIRNSGCYGIDARIMSLENENWYTPLMVTDFDNAWDGGYPSSIQLENGDIVTAYYCGPVSYHNRYHMGVTIWNIKEKSRLNKC
jgi:hypothetical protein